MTRAAYSVQDIKDMLLDRVDQVAHAYAPAVPSSYTRKGRYFTLNPGRIDRHVGSFYIYVTGSKKGRWQDHATGDYGDIIDLIALSLRCDNAGAIRAARGFLGLENEDPAAKARHREMIERSRRNQREAARADAKKRECRARQAQAIFLGASDQLRNSPVDLYLRGRGINLAELGRQPGVIRFAPECYCSQIDEETGQVFEGKYPAMVAAVTNYKGEFVAVHRTYLAPTEDGGWTKAPIPKPKKVLGDYPGAAINVWRGIGPRGGKPVSLPQCAPGTHVFVTEGIEDALSVVSLNPELRVIAAISLGNMAGLQLPAAVHQITFVADKDENEEARAALNRALEEHNTSGRTVRLWQNRWGGKDLNDALQSAQGAA
ncbi:MAG: toprim domain-containing protein [Pseudomonadota bacterium]